MEILAKNKKLKFNYEILETFEAGIELFGFEVKSIRKKGSVNLAGTYILIQKNEVFWVGARIKPYQQNNIYIDYNETRNKKLLLKRKEINYLIGKSKEKGLTLMPVMLYTKRGFIKMELALVRGKKTHDKRESIKKREINRRLKRELKSRG
ncbi:MAG: SsrA-binding protein SmpB [Candidatus Pacebacteria bacterium]|jgi:SsrA-binding protein|nr:SsrA-binding protein SmpB [Candidatus Paceibacterota bacterium]MDD2796367.1 SsrA-binding protein SmpB [Candidatus Paceibacterota bacterium]MDD3048009.1 SsrA-binding protein SmpB [Candidatus Paceibacterota bacterium]MDD3509852.1 SsrA-binding protein SmpB [Candidatus Paceibacterota bacterium]MDD3918384.1 SsrA-binding protein SmpB [Candidatus Paceibacterota bacterium]